MRNPLEHSAVYRWYRQRRGFFAFVVIVALAGVGLIRLEGIADDAHDAADQAQENSETNAVLIERARKLSRKARRLARKNARLSCSIGEAISSSPVPPRPDETPADYALRVRILRELARDLRAIDDCDPEHPIRIEIPEESRPILREGLRQLPPLEGGDVAGPPPGGGGGPTGGETPPSDTEPSGPGPEPEPSSPSITVEPGADCPVNADLGSVEAEVCLK